jgi:hypothetical protein
MCLRQAEMFGSVIVLGVVSAILLPLVARGVRTTQVRSCAQNLRILQRTGAAYAATHRAWPAATGENLWLSFTRTTPPLLKEEALEVLVCPVLGNEPAPDLTDYRGPKAPWLDLAPSAPLAADKPGNHGEDVGGCVLYKDGRVEEHDGEAWKAIASRLSP